MAVLKGQRKIDLHLRVFVIEFSREFMKEG